jgi:hypothetical protein
MSDRKGPVNESDGYRFSQTNLCIHHIMMCSVLLRFSKTTVFCDTREENKLCFARPKIIGQTVRRHGIAQSVRFM